MATPLNDTLPFIEQVKKRPVIWDTSYKFYGDKHKLTAAWRQICKINWPDFDTRQADDKRVKCLDMQKKWKELRLSFIEHQQQKHGASKHQYEDQLAFFRPVISSDGATSSKANTSQPKTEDERPPKRRRTDVEPLRQSVTSSGCRNDSQEARERDGEEDRQFLMSLVSFMQDVPRSSKLALRAEMMQLIMKYTQSQEPTDSPQY